MQNNIIIENNIYYKSLITITLVDLKKGDINIILNDKFNIQNQDAHCSYNKDQLIIDLIYEDCLQISYRSFYLA